MSLKINSPRLVEKIWGGRELGKLFDFKLPKNKLIGECWVFYDKKSPIVLKLLDVKKPLSVQVHPRGKNGKNELWYVVKAGASAKVLLGAALNEYKVKAGDWVYLPGGIVHTILPPAVLFEVSRGSLITYRLYDWGRGTRPLDIERGIKAINLTARSKILRGLKSFKCPYFKIKLLNLKKGSVSVRTNSICFVLKGSVKSGEKIIRKGEATPVKNTLHALTQSEVFLVN